MFLLSLMILAAEVSTAAPIPAREAAVPPVIISAPKPGAQLKARALGHHGNVIAKATVATDGSLKNIVIEQSSRSPMLDEAVLSVLAKWKVSPAKDANGNLIEVITKIPFSFEGDGTDLWLSKYRCDAFTRDFDWWKSANPDKNWEEDYWLYNVVIGARAAANPKGLMAGLTTSAPDGRADWNNAIQQCAKRPNELMIDQLPTASIIKRALGLAI